MTVQTVKIGKRDFDRLAALARRQAEQDRQDAGDVAESRRRRREPGGKVLAELRSAFRRRAAN